MRHRNKLNPLGRKSSHRKAMLSNMAASLILHKRIRTTLAKAKVLRTYVEPLITRAKEKEDQTPEQRMHQSRVVFSYLKNKYAVDALFKEVSKKVADRQGGYTRILKLGNRPGDSAEMCLIELVDYNENLVSKVSAKKAEKGAKRSRRAGSKKKTENTTVNKEKTEGEQE